MQTIIETLIGRSLTADDGFSDGELSDTEQRIQQQLPFALRTFYLIAGKIRMLSDSFQHFLSPAQLECREGMLLFLEENQGVCYWGIRKEESHTADPMVYQCQLKDDNTFFIFDEKIALADFLRVILYYQCAQGGYEYSGCAYKGESVSDADLRGWVAELADSINLVVEHGGLVIYQKGASLIWYLTDAEGYINEGIIFLSSRTQQDFDWMQENYGFTEL